jgi:hypothetical protein
MNPYLIQPRDLGAMAGHSGTGRKELERKFEVEGRVLNTQETFLYAEVKSISPCSEQTLFLRKRSRGATSLGFQCA